MPRHSLLPAFSLLMLTACLAPPQLGARATAAGVSSATLTLEDTELTDRWIVKLANDSSCPASSASWTVSQLFEPNSEGELPDLLDPFCVFEAVDGGSEPPDFDQYGDAAYDQVVVAGAGLPSDEEIWESTIAQIKPFPRYKRAPSATSWLAVLDTSPTGFPGYEEEGPDDHGKKLSTLARQAVCDSRGNCVVDILTQVTLGYTVTSAGLVRDEGGGTIGSLSDLATAIHLTVQRWEDLGGGVPLVINLSLGWHPEVGGGSTTMDPPVAAVYAAIEYATCQGALVIAAVGNQDSPYDDALRSGPLYPAAWEAVAAPDAATCAGLVGSLFTGEDPLGSETYTPLVYGVSAVDIRNQPLSNQRPDAQTPHAAAGAHLSAIDYTTGGSGTVLEPISGTSVSAAVVSAAAAVVWSHAPTRNAHEIMRTLRESADTKSVEPAETCYDDGSTTCGDSHVIQVCEALTFACDQGVATCHRRYRNTRCGRAPDPLAPAMTSSGAPVLALTGATTTTCADGTELIYDVENESNNCPSVELYGASALPITLPMPHGSECPWCPAYEGTMGQVELNTRANIENLVNPTIAVYRDSGVTRYALGPDLTGTENVVVLPDALDDTVIGMVFEYTTPTEDTFLTEPIYMTW